MKQRGITLIELMIVIAILGILVSIAYPSYTQYVQRSNRSEGMNELVRIANMQEQFFADSRRYAVDLTELGFPDAVFTTENGLYQIRVSAAAARTFTLTAVGQGVQANDVCATMGINQAGAKTASAQDCWR
ncbi:MAG TPA: type IV pilin protein [Rheinheimera sp.]|uniref:type IV pilin protein n=1 Tax=Rheinheimera sp. TaxID=1869214 RepID=UPI002F950A56